MKRVFAVLLTIAMLLSLVACGNGEPAVTEEDPTTEAPSTEEPSTEEPTTEEPTTEEPTTEEPTTEEPTTEEPTTEEPSSENQEAGNTDEWIDNVADAILGTRGKNKYESSYMGFGVELDADWYIYSEEELAAMLGITADQFNNENFAKMLESSASVMEFLASKADGSTISIARERLPYAMDDATYFNAAISLLESSLSSAGYENIVYELGTVDFMGEAHTCMHLSYNYTSIALYQLLVLVQAGDYVSIITATSLDPNQCAELLSGFYAVEN